MFTATRSFSLLFLALFSAAPVVAQSVSLGADVVSRYVWRGTDFGESMSIQPSMSISHGGLEIGTWASYSLSPDGAGSNEHDLWIGYTYESELVGSFSIGITDYYFPAPNDEKGFFNFEGDGNGSHFIEPYISYSAAGSFPITLYAALMAHNDPDNSLYVEASFPFTIEEAEMELTAGMTAGESAFYGTEGAELIQVGLSASRELPILNFPVSVAYILNPVAERSFLVFGVSISL